MEMGEPKYRNELAVGPFRKTHLGAFTAWFNALPNNNHWTEAWISYKTLEDETYDPALMLAAERNGEPVGFVIGNVANNVGWIRAFIVHPDRRRRGIGSALFEAVEQSFRAQGISEINVGWALPRYLLPGVDLTYTSAITFLDRHGYQTNRETRVNMDVILTGRDFDTMAQEALLLKHDITVRRAVAQDRGQITQLCLAENSGGWAIETGMALDMAPIPVFVATRHGKIVAFATHSLCGPIQFGPMLTATELRGKGVGSLLLKRCLRDWQQAGIERCEISWAGPLSFYTRTVGATMGRAFWAFHKSL